MQDTGAIGGWLHNLDVRRAGSVVPVRGGAVLLHDRYPAAYDHNKLSILEDTDGSVLAAAADEVLGGAGRTHRQIEMRTPQDEAASVGLLGHGYTRGENVVMTYQGSPVRSRPAGRVDVLTLAQRAHAAEAGWRLGLPQATPDVWRQLGERISTVVNAAQATFLAVLDTDGQVLAHADLYVDAGVAQIEEVVTQEDHRGKGLATLLVLEATQLALGSGAETVFLIADADDWPRFLYEGLGFRTELVLAYFTSDAAP